MDFLEEEMRIMDENTNSANNHIEFSIDDPISSLHLNKVITISAGSTLSKVINVLNEKAIGAILVVDKNNDTVGIFTERDILRKVVNRSLDFNSEIVDNFMTKNLETLCEKDPIAFALNRMSEGSYRHIPITKDNKIVYMLSVKDIVDQISFYNRKRVLNLPPNLKQVSSQYGG